jgi:hypothetical protein
MFDNAIYTATDDFDTAKEKRKIKKMLFNKAKTEFSDLDPFKYKYYECVNRCLHNENIEGKELDKAIVQCKFNLQQIEKYVSDTNQHAKIKINRCIKSKREWARKLNRDLATEEKGVWECLNRYHRRYLYYFPGIRDRKIYL